MASNILRSAILVSLGVAVTGFFSTCAVAFSLMSPGENKVHRLARMWSRTLLAMSSVKVRVIGGDNVLEDKPQIFMANHQSDYDIFVVLGHIPSQFRWIAKKELFKIPVFGKAMRNAGYIEIDRRHHEKALRSIDEAAEKIREGKSVMSFPEGTRSRDMTLKPFKQGAFHLAIQSGVPIIPISLVGTGRILPKRSLQINPGNVIMVIDKPIETKEYTIETRHELIERVRNTILRNYEAYSTQDTTRGAA
ncbi:MAG: 1-acyl-sn-glycerol-3-phosphate acyltransferase [Syntrophaceae bacterium]|nr:1-acyl-sn-glycerol-3-phosphate acyltransferase [Syntrophaceae bacterium]